MPHWARWIGGAVSFFAAVFTLPATADDYPESWQWWQGQIAGIDGDHFKNAVFYLAMAAVILFAFGPVLWAKAKAAVASPPSTPRFSSLSGTRRRFDPDALANDLGEAVAGASALIEGRWAAIPKTGPSHPRTDFGDRHYEAATLGKYKEQYQARLNTLVSTARQHRRATAAEALAGRVYDLDDFWVFMSLLSQVIRRLRGDDSARPIQKKRDDQIAQLQKWGWEVAQAIQRGTLADGRLEQIPKTPYQGFSEWWHEAARLLGDPLGQGEANAVKHHRRGRQVH